MPNTRRYTITLTDAESREVVIFTDAHWTTEQRQIVVGTILRLAGVPDDDYWRKAAEPWPKDRNP
jgi:hypothetical protein